MTTAQPPGKEPSPRLTPEQFKKIMDQLGIDAADLNPDAKVGMTVAQFYKGVVAVVVATVAAVAFFYTKVAQKDDLVSLASKTDLQLSAASLTSKIETVQKDVGTIGASLSEVKGDVKVLNKSVNDLNTQVQVLAAQQKKGDPR